MSAPFSLAGPAVFPGVKVVSSLRELVETPFADGVNALCWPRALEGDFAEVVARLGAGEEIEILDEVRLRALPLSPAGRVAADFMLADLECLRELSLDPVLNCIRGYPVDEEAGVVPVDVFSWHVDRAPVQADTWLCTYHGPASEGLVNAEARRRVDDPPTRAALLAGFGGPDDGEFLDYLAEECYDLHYVPLAEARPWGFGQGNLWRIAVAWPGSPVPPCIHRAPATPPGTPPRLLLIS